jgi:hypothetical protein
MPLYAHCSIYRTDIGTAPAGARAKSEAAVEFHCRPAPKEPYAIVV